jgi:hypothetical protein
VQAAIIGARNLLQVGNSMEWLRRIEGTDGDVASIRITKRKLHRPGARIRMWLFFQLADE